MRLIIQSDANQMAQWAANYIAAKINKANPTSEKPFVLGLPTGSSPLLTYKALIKLYESGVVSFENVITFNMDEYIGLPKDHPQSYYTFMWQNFFNHIDIKKENVHILNGMAEDPEAECRAYEDAMKDAGGVDLFLGGIGPDGH
ncbi:MAG TPA: glucosamine-6-phosphate deaminase, partial [Porphyromonadaceae bacterium]|nr:glucosamine-6-phosphate deaminase [Porphyromonadaceae bacterium]